MCSPFGSTLNSTNYSYTQEEILQYLSQLQHQSTIAFIPTLVYVSLLFVVGTIGNSLVLIVYWKKMPLTPLRVFVIGMAVCDLLTNIFVLPGEIYDMLHVWNFDLPIVCKVRLYLNATFVTSSSFLLIAIANTRYKMVCYPFDPSVTLNQAKYSTVVMFITALITSLPYAIIQGSQTINTPDSKISGCVCQLDDVYAEQIWPIVNSVVSVLMFLVGSILIVVFYANIGRRAWKQRTALIKVQQNCFRHMKQESESDKFVSNIDLNLEMYNNSPVQKGEMSTSESDQTRNTTNTIFESNSVHVLNMTYNDNERQTYNSSNDVKEKTDMEIESGSYHKQSIMSETVKLKLDCSCTSSKLKQKRTYILGRTSCTMLTVTLFFFLGFLPFLGLNIFMAFEPVTVSALRGVDLVVYTLFLRSYLINCAVNPIIYSLMDRKFRIQVFKLFRC